VFKNIRIFKQNKTDEDALLDRVHVRTHFASSWIVRS
jgi:hypothetical protein